MSNEESLESQIRQVFASVVWTQKIHEKESDILRKKYRIIEDTKIVLSSIMALGVLSIIFVNNLWLNVATIILSFASILINTYTKTYDLLAMANEHKSVALHYMKIREELISLLCDIKIKKISDEDIIPRRDKILSELMDTHTITTDSSTKAEKLAGEYLSNCDKLKSTDEEIDNFLPVYLKNLSKETETKVENVPEQKNTDQKVEEKQN